MEIFFRSVLVLLLIIFGGMIYNIDYLQGKIFPRWWCKLKRKLIK